MCRTHSVWKGFNEAGEGEIEIWRYKVSFQIPRCSPHVSNFSINAKLQKRKERKGGQKEVATVSIPHHRDHRQRIPVNSRVSKPCLKTFLPTATCILADN